MMRPRFIQFCSLCLPSLFRSYSILSLFFISLHPGGGITLHIHSSCITVIMHSSLPILALSLLSASTLVAGHCKITAAKGDLGGAGTALGITANDGNSESDVTVFQGAQATTFGETPGVRIAILNSRFHYARTLLRIRLLTNV